MARLPDGDRPPHDGALPAAALRGLRAPERPFGIYLHVPYCTTICGYCDFNTYIPDEAGMEGYAAAIATELALARRVLSEDGATPPPVQTVFVGGGTPTLLPPADLAAML